MDYEKKYKEALERAKEIKSKILYSHLSTESCKAVSEYIDTIIPELTESGDERIIKTLQEYVKNRNWNLNGPTQGEVLAWLEKQKEQKWNDKIKIAKLIRQETGCGLAEASNGFDKLLNALKHHPKLVFDHQPYKLKVEWEYDDDNYEVDKKVTDITKVEHDKEMQEESEDDRIRKFFAELATDACGGPGQEYYEELGLNYDKVMSWLEKQKENIEKEYVFRPLTGTDITIAAEQAIRRANEGDCLVLAFNGAYIPVSKDCNANKIVDIYDAFIEKQKEQNGKDEECTDFTIYHPLKNGKGKYECIPYSFYGSLTSFSEDKDLIDFLRTCFYTEEECNEWIEQQKEQKPELQKPHKGNDTNPYDMSVSEAQEYAIKRGFGIPYNDGEVYVDERHMTQTIGNILRWADEHPKEQKPNIELIQQSWYMEGYLDRQFDKEPKWVLTTGEDGPKHELNPRYGEPLVKEQKPLKYLDKKKVYAVMTKLNNLSCSQLIPINSDEYKKLNEITSDVHDLLDYPIEQKPVEWSEEDKALFELLHECVCRCINDDRLYYSKRDHISKTMIPFIEKLQTLYPQQDWSEEDERMQNVAIRSCEQTIEDHPSDIVRFKDCISWLKSLPKRINLPPKQQWSEEDERNFYWISTTIQERHLTPEYTQQVHKILAWLKSLRNGIFQNGNTHWKPSEEQMEALNILLCRGDFSYVGQATKLQELYIELKKLM